jgi:hypothetical protein
VQEEGLSCTWALLQGADWFESALVDYDVCSNWGNWVSAAGLTGNACVISMLPNSSKLTFCKTLLIVMPPLRRRPGQPLQYHQAVKGKHLQPMLASCMPNHIEAS